MSAPIISGEAETRVQETADDAALSKISAIRMGYFNDPFMSYFVRKSQRRSPLINRGYFARMAAVDLILRRFLAVAKRTGDGRSQIVSLGAGHDSTFFRLWADGTGLTRYFEVDFPEVTSRKAAIIRKHPVLQACVAGRVPAREECVPLDLALSTSPTKHGHGAGHASGAAAGANEFGIQYVQTPSGGCDIRGVAPPGVAAAASSSSGSAQATPAGPFRLVTADLRDVAAVQASLTAAGIDVSIPTLFLSECVLVYLEPEESCAIIAWAARTFQRSAFVTYEQIRPNDAFGQVMARNLEERGYSLRGLHAFPDLRAQTARYRELGYASATVDDMNSIYYRLLPRGDVARAERLELFDEVEEWHLMSAHYCIAIAVNEIPLAALKVSPPAGAAAAHSDKKGAAGGSSKGAKPHGMAVDSGAAADDLVTDMPAPPPKLPGASGKPAAAQLTAPGSSTVLPSQAAAHSTAHSALSPKELAAAVVHAHEAAGSEPNGSDRSRSLQRSVSGRSSTTTGASGAPGGYGSGLHAFSSSSGAASPGQASMGGRSDRSRSRSVSGADVDMVAAFESASGTLVDHVEHAHGHGHGEHGAAAGHAHAVRSSTSSSSVGGGGGGPPLLTSPTSPTPSSSASLSSHGVVLHTHGGSVHVLAGGADGVSGPDFVAIASAEEEMTHARHLREAVGMDVAKEIAAAADAARAGQEEGGAGGPPRGRSRSSSFASTGSSVSMPGGGGNGPHGPRYAPAVEGSRAAISVRAQHHYSPAAVAEAARVSLLDVLLPLEQWRPLAPAAAGGSGGAGHAHA